MTPLEGKGSLPSWVPGVLVLILALQLGMSYLQGRMLHEQRDDIRAIREELQAIGESLEQGQAPAEEESFAPAGRPRRLARMRHQEEDAARKELEQSRDSAQRAVERAKDTQRKLSLEENIRKAEEARKRKAAGRSAAPLLLGGLAAGLGLFLLRGWLRRRG